jgi:hypothetical protein
VTAGKDLALRCSCGAVRGVAQGVEPSSIIHGICYCDDCQAFAHFLGRADDVLDAHGGTEVVQMSQARLAFSSGRDKIAAMRLTPKGLMRWYASCCNTPIGNTLATPAAPLIGVIRAFVEGPAEALGPIRGRGWANRAKGGRAAVPKDVPPVAAMVARMLVKLFGWRLRGDHKRSALFDAATGAPLATARVLHSAEREELRRRCARWRGEAAGGGST